MVSVGDTTMSAVEYALDGLARRADVRAHNLANVNTPGFLAGRVDFETALQAAMRAGDPSRAAAPAVQPDLGMPDAQGNTVSLETEVVGLMRDGLLRDAMVNAYNFKVGVLRTAIGGR